MDRAGIADFLRRRRRALQPGDVGLQPGRRRRTAGLRREEVATLANISTDFYARLEQRRGARPSKRTVDALARAMRLTQDERDYLFRLAGHGDPLPTYRSDVPSPVLVQILERLDAPAQIISDLGVTLRQNALAQSISGVQTGRIGLERSMMYRWFVGSEERRRIPAEDHDLHSRRYVAHLRGVYSRSAADCEARALVDELHRRSREFAQLWDQHEVALIMNWPKRIRHRTVGVISFDSEGLSFQNRAEVLLVFTAAPDSDDAERLAFLSASVSKNGPTR
jgi:transcriptional regulator with XRE-family HTH domain